MGKLWGMLLVCMVAPLTCSPEPLGAQEQSPNIVYVFTDDQDRVSLAKMPNVRGLMASGTVFENATFTDPWCCPSRASMLTGLYPHNTGVWTNTYPRGGALRFKENSLEASTVAARLDATGYRTGLVGKYLNDNPCCGSPEGWDFWRAQVGDNSGSNVLDEDGRRVSYRGKHMDSVLGVKARGFVDGATKGGAPFFLWLSFNAPHDGAGVQQKYEDSFRRVPLPKSPAFDEADVSDKPGYVRRGPPLTGEQKRDLAQANRKRLRSLQTVDAQVGALRGDLRKSGELGNTYFVFWTDNGFHMGDHRMVRGKQTPYTSDSSFPLIVAGPEVRGGETRNEIVLNTDLAPTFAAWGGTSAPPADGRSFAPLLGNPDAPWRDAGLIEGVASKRSAITPGNPAYKAVRTEDELYVEYETGERELYDLAIDPYQLDNLTGTRPDEEANLSARLEALKGCSGSGCKSAEGP